MALFRNSSLLLLKRTQSVPVALYHANVSRTTFNFEMSCNCRMKNRKFNSLLLQPQGPWTLRKSSQRWITGQEGRIGRNWTGRCTRMWWCNETTNQSRRKRQNHRRQIQNVWLRIGYCVQFVGNGMGEGKDYRRGGQTEEHGHCQGTVVAAGQIALLEWVLFIFLLCVRELNSTSFPFFFLVLAEDAIKAALADYKIKKEKASKG